MSEQRRHDRGAAAVIVGLMALPLLLFVAFAASYFWIVLTVLAIAYLALLPVGFVRYRQLERHHAEAAAAGGKGAS